jgi:hypothetical protein
MAINNSIWIPNNTNIDADDASYGNGIWVAINNGVIHYSTDGINWTDTSQFASSVVFGNGLFVAVGSGINVTERIKTSTDGINWTTRTTPSPELIYPPSPIEAGFYNVYYNSGSKSITYGNGKYVAVSQQITSEILPEYGGGFEAFNGLALVSTDGINWTEHELAFPVSQGLEYKSITYGNGKYVVFNQNLINHSTDGINWVNVTPNVTFNFADALFQAFIFANGFFLVGHSNNKIYKSTDGTNWTASNGTQIINSIAFGNSNFVATGGSLSYYSVNGLDWSLLPSTTVNLEKVFFGDNKFISFSGGTPLKVSILTDQLATLTLGTTKGSLNLNWTNGDCVILPSDVVQYEFKLYLDGSLYLTQILTRNSKSLDFQPAGDYYYTVDIIKNGTICSSGTSNTVTILPYELDYDFSIQLRYGNGVITVNGSSPLSSYVAGTLLNISTTLGNGFNSVKWYDSANPSVILSSSPSFVFPMPSRGVRIFGVMSGTYLPTDDYGLKYFAEYGSIEGNCKRLEILKDGYNSELGTTELKVSEVTFGWGNQGDDPLKTIIGSYLDFELIGEDGDFDEFLLGDAKTFQVKYYENRTDTIPFFVGYISPDFITVLKTQTIQRYSFTAIDGLKALDAVRANTAWEFTTADLAISGALNQEFPIARNVNYHANIWENRMNQAQNLFSQFKTPYSAIFNEGRSVDFKDGERIVNERLKVSEVIQRLVNPFLCRVFLWRNEFYVTRIPDIISDPISEVDVTCIINNPEQTAHRVYTDYTATLKLASLDFSARGGVVDQLKSVEDWYIRSPVVPYAGIYNLRAPWTYVRAIPSNRPKKRPETSTALIQYNEEFESARIWTSSNQQGLADPFISYMDFNTAFSGIAVAQETANTLAISFEYMAWPTTTVTATTLNNYRMAFRVKVGSYYLRKINATQFDWTTTETDIVETIPGATVFHKYSISGMVVPEDGDVEVRFYQIICVGGQAHLFSIDWKNLNINIEGNTSLSLAEKAVSAQTIDSFNNEHPEYVTHIGDAETNNSTSAIILTGINEFSENWGRDESESLPLLDLIVQDLANLKGRRNQRIRGTVERQEIKPYQLIEHNGEKFMVISIKLDTYRNRWECELFQLS